MGLSHFPEPPGPTTVYLVLVRALFLKQRHVWAPQATGASLRNAGVLRCGRSGGLWSVVRLSLRLSLRCVAQNTLIPFLDRGSDMSPIQEGVFVYVRFLPQALGSI